MKGVDTSSPLPASGGEKGFAVLVLLLSTGAFLNVGLNPNSDLDAGRAGLEVMWSFLYLITLIEFFKCWREAKRRLRREVWLILLMGFICASALWSEVPLFTERRAIALVFTTLFGVYFASRYPLKQQLRLLSLAFTIAAVASVFFELLGLGTNLAANGVQGWIGVYFQKQYLGLNMALATAVMLIMRKCDPAYRSWAGLGAALTFSLLLLSRSATALVIFLLLMVVFPFLPILCKRLRTVVLICLLSLPLLAYGFVWSFNHLDTITGLLGKDPTLTGRVPLWILSTFMALQRPWFGYGYDAFWRGKGGATINRVVGWEPNSAHNAFLQIWLDIGIIGLSLFAVILMIYLGRAVTLVRKLHGAEGMWPIFFLLLMLLSNLSQSLILNRNGIFWIMFVAIGLTSAQLPVRSAKSLPSEIT